MLPAGNILVFKNGEIPEEQETLDGNAAQKAFFIYNLYGIDCFADDTGLEIEALQGEPGITRPAGPGPCGNLNNDYNYTQGGVTAST